MEYKGDPQYNSLFKFNNHYVGYPRPHNTIHFGERTAKFKDSSETMRNDKNENASVVK